MFDIVSKEEYFDWLEKKIADPRNHTLKGIQDAWILSFLQGKSDLKIAEVGGGRSRILQSLSKDNECWNIDKFEGVGAGPKGIPEMEGIKVVPLYLGSFDETLPSNYFDVVFSISVVEHVPNENLENFFTDCHRILKPGGIMLHAIDLYVSDESEDLQTIKLYRQAIKKLDFEWFSRPQVNKNLTFKCDYASNSDITMHQWNQIAPTLRKKRENSQSIVLKLVGFKKVDSAIPVASDISTLRELSGRLKAQQADVVREKKDVSHSKASKQDQETQVVLSDETADQTTDGLMASLLGRIANYYSRWPVVLAAVAILLNTASCFDALSAPLQLVLVASGTTTLLFLIGHAASKADYVLTELEKLRDEI